MALRHMSAGGKVGSGTGGIARVSDEGAEDLPSTDRKIAAHM
jgi:hypothetical protein